MNLLRVLNDESGVTAIEYALIAASIAVVIAVTVGELGTTTLGLFTSACNAVRDAFGGGRC